MKPLDDTTSTGISDVLDSLKGDTTKEEEATVPAPAPAKTTPVVDPNLAPEKTFTQVRLCVWVCKCVCLYEWRRVGGMDGAWL